MSQDIDFNLFTVCHSASMPKPVTLASAATIAPTCRFTRLTGTTPVTTITPPFPNAYHELVFVWTTGTANGFNTGGNIAVAYTTIADRPIVLYYDPRTALYYPAAVV